ncbi:MAG TPA: sulfatase-like hydrolase/transferase, partial [Chloroflexota bacterium]|nr:sulfatase-like hydrolase/transferase [Chloroflexota bacterium]
MGRGLLGITLVAALLFTSHAGVAAEGRLAPVFLVGRPNIVVVMVDDLDVASLKRMLATPSDVPGRDSMMHHLKRSITDVGFELTNAFVTNSVCCPSRATFLTGKYSHNHGVLTNWRPTGGVTLLDDSSTLATWLRAAGYRTGYVGKYLNGYGSWNDSHASYRPGTAAPDRRLEPTYVPPGWDRWWGLIDPFTYLMYGYRINENGVERRYGTEAAVYQTDTLAQHARTFIGESLASAGNQPFFLLVTPLAPHIDTSTISSVTSYKDVWRWTVPPAPRHVGTVPVSGTPEYESKPSFNETDLTDKPFTRPLLDDMDRAALRKQYQDRLESLRAVDDLIGTL